MGISRIEKQVENEGSKRDLDVFYLISYDNTHKVHTKYPHPTAQEPTHTTRSSPGTDLAQLTTCPFLLWSPVVTDTLPIHSVDVVRGGDTIKGYNCS